MKEIRNKTRQHKKLLVNKNGKSDEIVIAPSQTIVIPESWITCQTHNMARMQFISIANYDK